MKKFIAVVALVVSATAAQAFDGSVSGEVQNYFKDGYRNFEGNVEIGHTIPNLVRPFVSVQYFADNTNGSFEGLNAYYKLGVSKDFGSLSLSGGLMVNQTIANNTYDDKGAFVKAAYTFGSK
jgi:hypothetical protein